MPTPAVVGVLNSGTTGGLADTHARSPASDKVEADRTGLPLPSAYRGAISSTGNEPGKLPMRGLKFSQTSANVPVTSLGGMVGRRVMNVRLKMAGVQGGTR
jgi:hypothetical protein